MDSRNALLKYKQLLGIAVAGVILTVIFVPFQKANAFTIQLDIPNSSGGHVTQTTSGETFTISIDVEPSERISISTVDLIIDNGQPSVKRATFGSNGQYVSGAAGIIKNNTLTITPVATQTGYGYGFGTIASGISSSGYSFTFANSTTGFIGGNTGPSSPAPGANQVVGVVGPGTITIQTHLNTGLLSVGTHTIDVVIDSGAGGNGVDNLLAPQLTFTVDANSQVTTASVTSGTNVQTSTSAPGGGTITIKFDNAQSSGQIAIEEKSAASLDNQTSSIFDVVGTFSAAFTVNGGTANTAGTIYEIDISAIGHTGFIDVTIPYDPNLLPLGTSENNVKFYHWTGTAWEDVTISVDTTANTVTGRLTSLSPVVAGYPSSASTNTSTTTTFGGGGGGGSATNVIINQSFPADYFNTHPLQKLQMQDSSFKTLAGNTIFGAKPGQQVNVSATFHNYQQVSQDYAIIVQILDQNGFTTDLGWVTGTADAGANIDGSRSWTVGAAGEYTVKIYVWNGVSNSPTPLSEITTKSFSVTA